MCSSGVEWLTDSPSTSRWIYSYRKRRRNPEDVAEGSDEDEEDEEESEEEESAEEEPAAAAGSSTTPAQELSRADRKALKKKQGKKEQKGSDDEDDDDDEDLINPNHVAKKLTISDIGAPREMSRREREQKEKQEAKERYMKVSLFSVQLRSQLIWTSSCSCTLLARRTRPRRTLLASPRFARTVRRLLQGAKLRLRVCFSFARVTITHSDHTPTAKADEIKAKEAAQKQRRG